MSERADDVDAAAAPDAADASEAERRDDPDERPDAHLRTVDDGCGCAEVWEHLSEQRDE